MKPTLAWILALLCTCGVAFCESPIPIGPDKLAGDADVPKILEALQKAGTDLKNFDAKIEMTDFDPVEGSKTARKGDIWYQRRADGDDRMRVELPVVVRQGKIFRNEKIEYKLEDGWLWDRTYLNKTEVKRQVLKPGQKINVLKLGEGPLPLPIGQDPAEVRKQFSVTKIPLTDKDPAGSAHVQLVPTETNQQFKGKFKSIDVFVDPKTGFPNRIDTVDPSGAKKSTTLTDLKVNDPAMTDKDFDLPEIKDWNQTTEQLK